ncbi:MAG: hypothetical protein QXN53_07400 [Thermoproteota archaeon]
MRPLILSYRYLGSLRNFRIRFGPLAEELQEGFGAMEKEFRDYRNEFRDFAKRTDENL